MTATTVTTRRTSPSGRHTGWRGAPLWLLLLVVVAVVHAAWLVRITLRDRFARDVARLVFNDNSEALEQAALQAGAATDSLRAILDDTPAPSTADADYLVVSIADRRVWYKHRDSVLFTAQVATGSGKQLVIKGNARILRFETPRGRLTVQRRDSAPAWIPPDWHYQEQANKRGMGMVQLVRGVPLKLRDGSQIIVQGNDVVRRGADGAMTGFAYPEMMVDVCRAHAAGHIEKAHDIFDAYLPLARYEQQAGIGLAVRKHLLAQRGVIASAAIRKPGPKLSAPDIADIARLVSRQSQRLAQF